MSVNKQTVWCGVGHYDAGRPTFNGKIFFIDILHNLYYNIYNIYSYLISKSLISTLVDVSYYK